MKKIHKLSKILSILVVVTVLGGLTLYTHTARSSALQNMSGFAWGGDWTDQNGNNTQELDPDNIPYEPTGGVGWISFNCTTGGNCGSDDYGVNIEDNGDLVGYAWSSNYGWLKFGGLGGFPSGAGTVSANAKLTGNNVTGWARFCAGAADPLTCDGTVSNSANGGWDGWLALSGNWTDADGNHGVTLTGGAFSGYAWGGNDGGRNVVGWLDFTDVTFTPVTGPTVSLTVESDSIPTGGHVELSWLGANLINSPTGCEATGGAPSDGWPADRISPNGTFTTNPISANGTYTYNIRCMGTNGEFSPIRSVTVTVGVTLGFYAEPSPVYSNNDFHTVLHWAVSPAGGDLHDCQATSTTPGEDEWDGADIANLTLPASYGPVYVPADPTNFTITCKNALEVEVEVPILVYREDLPENVEFDYDQVYCSGFPQPCTTNLDWELTNAESCVASSINPSSGIGWEGNIPVPPNSGTQFDVLVTIAPPGFTTYILDCKMDSGQHIIKTLKLNTGSGASQPPIYQEN